MRYLCIALALFLGAPLALAACPTPNEVGTETDPPSIALAGTARSNEFVITVRASKPFCMTYIEVESIGNKVPLATLMGPSDVHGVQARGAGSGQRFSFPVSTWLPAGDTRYELWFPSGQTYVALEPTMTLWRRSGAAAIPMPITQGSWGIPPALPQKKHRIRRP